jgi:phosphoribosylanthranilate isomerase
LSLVLATQDGAQRPRELNPWRHIMSVEVKICGLSTAATMQVALDARADYVGLVFFDKSPRHVEFDVARALADQARGRARVVALVVDADDQLIDRVVGEVAPDMLQLHGSETPARVAAIKQRTGCGVMKVIKVGTARDAAAALEYSGIADLILFDAKAPAGALLPGGNGIVFDWRVLDDVKDKVPYMLSGGLTPQTVADAIRQTGATRVDVSSGVELRAGQKSAELIRAFIANAKAASNRP